MSLEERKNLVEDGNYCVCVGKHVPLPTTLYRLGDVYLCPTAWENAQAYEIEMFRHRGRPPGHIRKHFSEYIQNLFVV